MFRMMITTAALLLGGGAACADTPPRFFLRGGPAFATFDAAGVVDLDGQKVPGADASVKNNTGFAFETGYFIRPEWSVSLTIGVPPIARIHGEGTLASAGLLGTAHYGPTVLAVQFNPPVRGPFRPYIGAGFSYTLVYDTHGSAIRNLKVSDGNGPAIQAGVEYRMNNHWAVFFDAKKIWVAVDAWGLSDTPAGALPAHARVDLDPVILNTGISWHF